MPELRRGRDAAPDLGDRAHAGRVQPEPEWRDLRTASALTPCGSTERDREERTTDGGTATALDASEIETRALEMQALICQALSDPKRLRLLHALEHGERSVGELAETLGASIANASQHLGVLRGRGLVRARREGTTVLYSLAYPEILAACRLLNQLLVRQLAEGGELAGLLRPGG